MMQESELLKKVPFRQNLVNIRATLGMVNEIDKSYLLKLPTSKMGFVP